jgi:hypothetical protein
MCSLLPLHRAPKFQGGQPSTATCVRAKKRTSLAVSRLVNGSHPESFLQSKSQLLLVLISDAPSILVVMDYQSSSLDVLLTGTHCTQSAENPTRLDTQGCLQASLATMAWSGCLPWPLTKSLLHGHWNIVALRRKHCFHSVFVCKRPLLATLHWLLE